MLSHQETSGIRLVSGLVSAGGRESIFGENDHGWFEITVEIEFPLPEDRTLELAFLMAAQQKLRAVPVARAKEIRIHNDPTRT